MPLNCLIPSFDWDNAFFKVLANNDSGSSKGNQSGVLIPVPLRPFFPGLVSGSASALNPTVDKRITAELFNQNNYLGTVSTRYQFQTWGGTRKPESRLTDNLTKLLNLALGGDILLIQRRIQSLEYFRLTLVPRVSPDYAMITSLIGNRRWGVLKEFNPVSVLDLQNAQEDEDLKEAAVFNLFDFGAATNTTSVKRVARSLAFRLKVISLYSEKCSFCGQALKSPNGLIEVDAAHVVPRSIFGSDDARNGVALCKRHHWAFDHGLAAVSESRTIIVSSSAAALPENHILNEFNGATIREACLPALKVDPAAFKWHRENVFREQP